MYLEDWMTVAPQTIGAEVSVAAAQSMMRAFGIRHLPVRNDGHLVGVVADVDVDALPPSRLVLQAMRAPLIASPTDRVDTVTLEMAERQSDAAIVVSGDRVVGIFTASDIERARAATLR